MDTRSDRAARMFDEVANTLTSSRADLEAALRHALRAAQLGGMAELETWCHRELVGYPEEADLPPYRRRIEGTFRPSPTIAIAGGGPSVYRDFRDGVGELLDFAQEGYLERRNSARPNPYAQAVVAYDASSFRRMLDSIVNEALDRANRAHIALAYGDAVADIWQRFRVVVDARLSTLGLENQLAAVQDNMASENPERWRAAMWSCRDVLSDLGRFLWRDPSPDYPPVKVNGAPLKVQGDNYLNKLLAYLHCKAEAGHTRDYVRAEIERLNSLLHRLNALDSKAHAPVDRGDADLAVVGTYLLIHELIRLTDMEPVEQQDAC